MSFTMESNDTFQNIAQFYKKDLERRGWSNWWPVNDERALWAKDKYGIGLSKISSNPNEKTRYTVYFKFWDTWFKDIKYSLQL